MGTYGKWDSARVRWAVAGVVLGLAACGSSDGDDAPGAVDASPAQPPDAAIQGIRPDAGPPIEPVASSCPALQFATGFDGEGRLTCAPIDAISTGVLSEQCTVFAGWRDSCDGCTDDPSKWGQVQSDACANGVGADNTCTTPTLGAATVNLFGLNPDGDLDGNDKLYMGLRCGVVADQTVGALSQCLPGRFMNAVGTTEIECATVEGVVSEYVRNGCQIYYGVRDNCDGCTTAPAKVGRVGSTGCANIVGADNTCIESFITGDSLQLFGLNTDGDVNGDDKFYAGLHCAGASAETSTTTETCPPGQLVTEVETDGTIVCSEVAAAAEAAVQQGCHLYFGWRDNCEGCTDAPAKWGRVSGTSCENGAGANNTCGTHTLDGEQVMMFGLNTDGDVNGDDTFFVGLQCE